MRRKLFEIMCYTIFLFVVAKHFGFWIAFFILFLAIITTRLIINQLKRKIGYDVRKEKSQRKMNEFLYASCKRCGGEGKEGGCPYCGCWPGLGKYTILKGEKYYFIGNIKKMSMFFLYHYLLKKLGKKIIFTQAENRRGEIMPSNWIGMWTLLET